MPPSETSGAGAGFGDGSTGLLDRSAERAARWLAERSSRRSRLGRLGDAAVARVDAALPKRGPAPPAPAPAPSPVEPAPAVPAAAPSAPAAPLAGPAIPAAAPAPPTGDVPAPASPAPTAEPLAALHLVPPARVAAPMPGAPGGLLAGAGPAGPLFDQDTAAPDPGSPSTVEGQPGCGGWGERVVELSRVPAEAAAAISAARFPTAAAAVLVPADPLLIAVAAPVAAVLNGPLLIAGSPATEAELARLQPTRIVSLGVDAPNAERLDDPDTDPSTAAAALVRDTAGSVRAFAIGATTDSHALAGPVGAAAAARRYPVMIGADAARRGATEGARRAAVTYLVGKEAVAHAAEVPGGFPLPTPTDADVPARLVQLLKADRVEPQAAAVLDATSADPVLGAVLAGCGGVVVRSTEDLPTPAPPLVFRLRPAEAAAPQTQTQTQNR